VASDATKKKKNLTHDPLFTQHNDLVKTGFLTDLGKISNSKVASENCVSPYIVFEAITKKSLKKVRIVSYPSTS